MPFQYEPDWEIRTIDPDKGISFTMLPIEWGETGRGKYRVAMVTGSCSVELAIMEVWKDYDVVVDYDPMIFDHQGEYRTVLGPDPLVIVKNDPARPHKVIVAPPQHIDARPGTLFGVDRCDVEDGLGLFASRGGERPVRVEVDLDWRA